MERQLQAEAERIRKEEIEAHQAALLRAEVERLKTEQLAAALRCVPFDLLDTAVERFSSLNFIAQHAHGTSPRLPMNFLKEFFEGSLAALVVCSLIWIHNFYRQCQVPSRASTVSISVWWM